MMPFFRKNVQKIIDERGNKARGEEREGET